MFLSNKSLLVAVRCTPNLPKNSGRVVSQIVEVDTKVHSKNVKDLNSSLAFKCYLSMLSKNKIIVTRNVGSRKKAL